MNSELPNIKWRWLIVRLIVIHALLILVTALETGSVWLASLILMVYLGIFGLCFLTYFRDITLSSAKSFDLADSTGRLAFKTAVPLALVYLVLDSINKAELRCLTGVSGSLALLFLIYTCGYGASLSAVTRYKRMRSL